MNLETLLKDYLEETDSSKAAKLAHYISLEVIDWRNFDFLDDILTRLKVLNEENKSLLEEVEY